MNHKVKRGQKKLFILGRITLLFYAFVFLSACENFFGNETVMSPGMRIRAENKNGTIEIESGKGRYRTLRWNNEEVTVKMWPRTKRWDGSLGLYLPGHTKELHLVLQEGQQHFPSEENALEWIKRRQSQWNGRLDFVYNSDGIVVGWEYQVAPDGSEGGPDSALILELWEIIINEKTPENLQGAQNKRVHVKY
ncbi:MAG: hypothetical protein H6860_04405 [Rhodospirillales bacterium]|nr:hypothetical protein [Rhodospirillales bacterium]